METPYTDHLTREDYEQVYEPAEDSFLMLDAIERDLPYLERLQPEVCMEIGCGSGILITALAKHFRHALCLASDINVNASRSALRTARRNATSVEAIHCNLADCLRPKVVDLLIFNPPYVVTTDEELRQQAFDDCGGTKLQNQEQHKKIVYAWAGGQDGMRVVDELLDKLDEILSKRGTFYLLLQRENKPDAVIERFNVAGGKFRAVKFMERRIPGEYLYIIKVTREQNLEVV